MIEHDDTVAPRDTAADRDAWPFAVISYHFKEVNAAKQMAKHLGTTAVDRRTPFAPII